MRLLIADDHDLFRDSMEALLREQDDNIDITSVANLGVAMYAVQAKERFDIVVLDMCMPGMDGLKGAVDMKAKVKDIPVVLMSGVERHGLGNKAKSIGLQGFLPKTLSGKSFFNALKLIVSGEKFFPLHDELRTIGTSPESLTLPDWSNKACY